MIIYHLSQFSQPEKIKIFLGSMIKIFLFLYFDRQSLHWTSLENGWTPLGDLNLEHHNQTHPELNCQTLTPRWGGGTEVRLS